MSKWGLTDLERGKYTADSTRESSTVRVRPDGVTPVSFEQPIDARIVDQPIQVDVISQPVHVKVDDEFIQTKPISFSSIPRETYRFGFGYLTNPLDATVNNVNQNVNGSVVPVDFLFTPSTPVLVEQITVVIVSNTIVSMLDYFSLGSLTNGVLLFSREGGIDYPFFNVRRAVEFGHPSDIGLNSVRVTGSQSEEMMVCHIGFKFDGLLSPTRSFGIRIRDNLLGIKYQRASVLFRTVTDNG